MLINKFAIIYLLLFPQLYYICLNSQSLSDRSFEDELTFQLNQVLNILEKGNSFYKSGRISMSVPKDLANLSTYIILFYSKASHRSNGGS